MAGQRQRPVEFRGLSTHYVEGEDICVSFRYPTSSFQPHVGDKIKLYARGARQGDKSIASAFVGDATKHRLCDGGLYKTGSVTITTATVSELATSHRSYVLLYGSGRLRQVVGKSDPFIICPQNEFPSIQIRSMEDNVFIEKLRAHSPIDNKPMFPKGVEPANGDKETSFVMVSDSNSLLADWESLHEEEGEEDGEDVEEREDAEERERESSSDAESWSEIGGNLRAISLSSSSYTSTSSKSESDTESENENPHVGRSDEAVTTHLHYNDTLVKPSASNGNGMLNEIKTTHYSETKTGNGIGTPSCTSASAPVPNPRRLNGTVKKTAEKQCAMKSEDCTTYVVEAGENTSARCNGIQGTMKDLHFQNSNGHHGSHQLEAESLPKAPARMLSVSEDVFPKGTDLTESMVLVENLTPEKVTMLKNSNKEMRTKVRVLHGKLHSVTEERDSLQVIVDDMQSQVSTLKHDKVELKRKNKKLAEEKATLKGKCKRLESENALLTQHCEKQVVQMSQYESQLTAVSSEKEELRRQLLHTAKKSKRRQESSEHHHKERRHNHQKTKTTQDTSNGKVALTSSKREHPTKSADSKKTTAPAQHGVFLQRPVIDVYVRDPPGKRETEKSGVNRESETKSQWKIEPTKKEGKTKCAHIHASTKSQHVNDRALTCSQQNKGTGML